MISRGGSLDRARTVISTQPEEFLLDLHCNLKKAWYDFRDVAPLSGAFYEIIAHVLQRIRSGEIPLSALKPACDVAIQQNLLLFITWTQHYYQFGIHFVPTHSGRSLLDPSSAWRVSVSNQLPSNK